MARLGVAALLLATLALSDARAAANEMAAPEPRAGHPEPRVIVTVTGLKGAHDHAEVQRSARASWAGIVRCCKQLGGRKGGTLTVRLEISATGKVVGTRRLASTLNDEVSSCLTSVLRDRTMPGAVAGSTATVALQLAPGDE